MPAAARAAQGVLPTLSEMVKMILQKLRDTALEEGELLSEAAAEEPSPYEEIAPSNRRPRLLQPLMLLLTRLGTGSLLLRKSSV